MKALTGKIGDSDTDW